MLGKSFEEYLFHRQMVPDCPGLAPHMAFQLGVNLQPVFPAGMAGDAIVLQCFHGGLLLLVVTGVLFEPGEKLLFQIAHFELVAEAGFFLRLPDPAFRFLLADRQVVAREFGVAQDVGDERIDGGVHRVDEGGGADAVAGRQFSSAFASQIAQRKLFNGGVDERATVVDRQGPLLPRRVQATA